MTLHEATESLTASNDKLERSLRGERPATIPPPAPARLTPERVAEIRSLTFSHHALLSMFIMNGVLPSELEALFGAKK